MTLPRSAADVLAGHVLFEIEAIDRMYLNLYQPRLQHGAGIAAFFVGHRGHRFASSALMAPVTRTFTTDIGHFVAARGLDLVRFVPGQRKDLVTAGYLSTLMRFRRDHPPALLPSTLGSLSALTGASELVFDAFLTPRGLGSWPAPEQKTA